MCFFPTKNMKKKKNIVSVSAIIITRKNPQLNLGQTVTVVGWDEFSDSLIVIPDGEKKNYIVHYTECWTYEPECNWVGLEKQLSKNGIWNTASIL